MTLTISMAWYTGIAPGTPVPSYRNPNTGSFWREFLRVFRRPGYSPHPGLPQLPLVPPLRDFSDADAGARRSLADLPNDQRSFGARHDWAGRSRRLHYFCHLGWPFHRPAHIARPYPHDSRGSSRVRRDFFRTVAKTRNDPLLLLRHRGTDGTCAKLYVASFICLFRAHGAPRNLCARR